MSEKKTTALSERKKNTTLKEAASMLRLVADLTELPSLFNLLADDCEYLSKIVDEPSFELDSARCKLANACAYLDKAAELIERGDFDPDFATELRRAAMRAADGATKSVLLRQMACVRTTDEKEASQRDRDAALAGKRAANGGKEGR